MTNVKLYDALEGKKDNLLDLLTFRKSVLDLKKQSLMTEKRFIKLGSTVVDLKLQLVCFFLPPMTLFSSSSPSFWIALKTFSFSQDQ